MPRARPGHFELAPPVEAGEARRLAWVDRVEELALRIARAGGLEDEGARRLGVAVREALMNALVHGKQRVAVGFRLVAGPALAITVRDRGPAFDPAALPDPLLPENLSRGAGRGVFFMRRFADEVTFAFPTRGGTVARLLKKLPAQAD